jgi:hypothetical protein
MQTRPRGNSGARFLQNQYPLWLFVLLASAKQLTRASSPALRIAKQSYAVVQNIYKTPSVGCFVYAGPPGLESYRFSIPIGYIVSLHSQSSSIGLRVLRYGLQSNPTRWSRTYTKHPRSGVLYMRAHQDSNLGNRFWRPTVYH